jgi:F420-non-reducing hydrogenase iron-sulfur subunit
MIAANTEQSAKMQDRAIPSAWRVGAPRIIAFCCNYCAFAAADLAGSRRMQYPAGVRIIHTPCTGKLEMEHILDAFEKGVDGVLVVGCLEGGCHYVEGNVRARKRIDRIRSILDEIGIGGSRLQMVNLSDAMAPAFVQHVRGIVETVKALGPSPIRALEQTESAGKV